MPAKHWTPAQRKKFMATIKQKQKQAANKDYLPDTVAEQHPLQIENIKLKAALERAMEVIGRFIMNG